jgi:hypothetical protein
MASIELKDGGVIVIEPDCIQIQDRAGFEIVFWNRDEWNEDGETAQAILNAVSLALEQGSEAVAAKIPPYPKEE